MSTPNMGLVLPTDHASAEIWDTILDTVFGVIDSHDHSPGKGVKVPSGGLNINGDVSWSSGGTSRSITDILALDFKPSPAASVTGFAGALFISDGTSGLSANELYFRTTAGTNVKFTSGAALNVGAFTGGIGGDYAAVSALEDFDDATDSYRFRQQIGAAVRQFARMQSADLDLFEFKANPAAGVPANRVRLASPTALAASYTLTMPGALPASAQSVSIDAAGAIAAGASQALVANANYTISGTGRYKHGTYTLSIHGNLFNPAAGAVVTYATNPGAGPSWTGGGSMVAGLTLPVGARFLAVRFFIKDSVTGPTTVTCSLLSETSVGVITNVASAGTSTGAGTNQTLTTGAITITVAASTGYTLQATAAGGTAAVNAFMAEVDYDMP